MKMKNSGIIQSVTLLVFLFLLQCSASGEVKKSKNRAYVKEACSVTAYPRLCYMSLARHSTRINSDPKILASMALNTTLFSARMTSRLLHDMAKKRGLQRNEGAAMVDCVEDIEDSVLKLGRYTGESEHQRRRTQMNDALMWVHSALDDDETCVEALALHGKVKKSLRTRIVRLARLTSNALALLNQAYPPEL